MVKEGLSTAIEDKTKLGYARVFDSSVSRNAADFLKRLVYLSEGDIQIIHSDNGSEFEKDFIKACDQLGIQQIYSRVKRPKDNPCLERFNWTVQDEWLSLSEVGLDEIDEANRDLTSWLIEYNANRPHESLDYLTPLEYASQNYFKVLPMWSANNVLIRNGIISYYELCYCPEIPPCTSYSGNSYLKTFSTAANLYLNLSVLLLLPKMILS